MQCPPPTSLTPTTLSLTSHHLFTSASVLTVVVCAHLERLVAAHDEAYLAARLVRQETHVARAALLPLLGLLVEAEKLGAPV